MVNQLTKAHINLFAILRNLEDLCTMDSEMAALIKDKEIAIQFTVLNGPKALLTIKDGKCTLTRGEGKSNIKLLFKSPEHLNQMFEGKANPIPLKGITKIDFLKNEFTKLTDKLAYYLKPTDELLKNPTYFKINTYLTAYTAFFALSEIGNTDFIGRLNSHRIPDGVIEVYVLNEGPAINMICESGSLVTKKGRAINPRAVMAFKNIDTVNAVLNGKVDSYTCMGSGDFQVKGFIPMVDNMNKLLHQVPFYVN